MSPPAGEQELVNPVLRRRSAIQGVNQDEQETGVEAIKGMDGGPTRTRTWDQRIMSPLL